MILTLADEMHRVHAALSHDLDRLPQALAEPAEARRFLAELRAHVAEHFRCEEQGGYMATVLERRPQSERAVQHLLGEHRPLLDGLDALLREAGAAKRIDDDFRARVRTWADSLRHHEAAENVLVEDTFNQDIGQKD
jgi:hypothetical protein